MLYQSNSQSDTFQFAYAMAEKANPGDVFCLVGELGAGKTVFAKGFAVGLGINEHVTSPTFTFINEYNGRLPFFHFDVYRIESPDEMEDLGYLDYFYGNGVCLVEWADMISGLIPKTAKWIKIERDYLKPDDYRSITIEGL